MDEHTRHIEDAIKIGACIIAAGNSNVGAYGDAHEVIRYARELYEEATKLPWRGGYEGWTPQD